MAAAENRRTLKLTVMSGAQRRFQRPYVETIEKIRNGALGDIVGELCLLGWHACHPAVSRAAIRSGAIRTWEHRYWYSFVWICGDQIVEQHLHNIDVIELGDGNASDKGCGEGGAVWRPREESTATSTITSARTSLCERDADVQPLPAVRQAQNPKHSP